MMHHWSLIMLVVSHKVALFLKGYQGTASRGYNGLPHTSHSGMMKLTSIT